MSFHTTRASLSAALLTAALGTSGPQGMALAYEYPVEVLVATEDDINELFFNGEIDETTRDKLINLLQEKVDLNEADRDELYELPGITYEMADAILAFREANGRFDDPADLALVPGIPPDVLLEAGPFVKAEPPRRPAAPLATGRLRLGALERLDDGAVPAAYLQVRGDALRLVKFGGLLTHRAMAAPARFERTDAGGYLYSPRDSTVVTPSSVFAGGDRYSLDHVFAARDTRSWTLVAGSYRIGFGLRLVMDNSGRENPKGPYVNNGFYENYESGDVRPDPGFFGAAFRLKGHPLGTGRLDATAFGSVAYRDLYQYDLRYGEGSCATDADCRGLGLGDDYRCDRASGRCVASAVYTDDGKGGLVRLQYANLSRAYRESTAGANVTWRHDSRNAVGVTGYLSRFDFGVEAPNVAFAPAAAVPPRPYVGAVGVGGSLGVGAVDLDVETALTGKGPPAAVGRLVAQVTPDVEVTVVSRYYPTEFENPHARSYANADEYQGNRARDEAGARLQVEYRPLPPLRLYGDADVWYHPSSGLFDAEFQFRPTLFLSRRHRMTLYLIYHDEDLSRGGRGMAYAEPVDDEAVRRQTDAIRGDEDFEFEPVTQGSGVKASVAASLASRLLPILDVEAYGKHSWVDVRQIPDGFDRDWYAWGKIRLAMAPGPSVALRVKYGDEEVADIVRTERNRYKYCVGEVESRTLYATIPGSCRGATYWDGYVELDQRFGSQFGLRLRGGVRTYVDDRAPPRGQTDRPDEWTVKGYVVAAF